MDDMHPFERQVAAEVVRGMRPSRPVDAAAVIIAVDAARSRTRRFRSLFSATKFVVAAAIVALFGGFLLAGVWIQPGDESLPAAASAGCDQPLAEPGIYDAINDFEGAAQAYRVVVPEGYADLTQAPVVLFLAALGDMEPAFEWWRPYLDPAQSIFVTVEQTTYDHARPATMAALIDQLAADYCIDARRVHAMGFSSSTTTVAALACGSPDRIGSFSVIMGNFHDTCSVPLIAVTGDYDRSRVEPSMERWAEDSGCDPAPVAEDLGSGVSRMTFQGCDADTVLYDVEVAGHGFIRQECVDTALAYCIENDVFDVLREVERFAAEHPLPS